MTSSATAAEAPTDTGSSSSSGTSGTDQAGAQASSATAEGATGERAATVDALVEVLGDRETRQQLLELLREIEEPQSPGLAIEETVPPEVLPEDLVDTVSGAIDRRVNAVVATFTSIADTLRSLPVLAVWLEYQITSDLRRAIWLKTLEGLTIAFGAGGLVWLAVKMLLRRSHRLLEGRIATADSEMPMLVVAKVVLDALPPVAFLMSTGLVLTRQELRDEPVAVGHLLLLAIAIHRALMIVTDQILSPRIAAQRLVPISQDIAEWLERVVNRIGSTIIYGYFGLRCATVLGLPPVLEAAFAHLLFIAVSILLTLFFINVREPLSAFVIRERERIANRFARALVPADLLAQYGYVLAILVVWAHYFLFALGFPGGFRFLLTAVLTTIGALVLSQVLVVWIEQRGQGDAVDEEASGDADADAGQSRRPTLLAVAKVAVRLAALLLVLEAWDAGIIAWFGTEMGQQLLDQIVRILVVLTAAFLVWTLISNALRNYLTAQDSAGNLRFSNRSRTLATMARNVMLVVISLFAGASVLSQMGIETGPLLAGAGVVGVAIGFGSQKLVQDIITGMFILLGDTIRVGDIVDIGGHAGVVDALSMRTVTLRAYNGHVITVPFSSIDTVTNMTKDFSYAVFDIGISYRENVDNVMQVVRDLEAQLRREWPYRRIILEPLEMAGVDAFGDSAVVIKARIKTRPGEQWRVFREFNRRLKLRFDEVGIEIPFPHRMLLVRQEGEQPLAPLLRQRHEMMNDDVPATAKDRTADRERLSVVASSALQGSSAPAS